MRAIKHLDEQAKHLLRIIVDRVIRCSLGSSFSPSRFQSQCHEDFSHTQGEERLKRAAGMHAAGAWTIAVMHHHLRVQLLVLLWPSATAVGDHFAIAARLSKHIEADWLKGEYGGDSCCFRRSPRLSLIDALSQLNGSII